jgi:MFS family permease
MVLRRISNYYPQLNKVILYLTYADIVVLTGWGLITPFLALYMTENIKDGSVALIGISTTIYFLIKSLLQIPIAKFLDGHKGEKDDFYFLLTGYFLYAVVALGFVFAQYSWQIYLIQVLNGIAAAIAYAPWTGIFTRHIDKNAESFEWSFYDTTTSLVTALTASLGGLLITYFDFKAIFIVVAVLSALGGLLIIGIRGSLYKSRVRQKS